SLSFTGGNATRHGIHELRLPVASRADRDRAALAGLPRHHRGGDGDARRRPGARRDAAGRPPGGGRRPRGRGVARRPRTAARLDGLGKTVVALALSPDGLYEPVPTVPIRIVALILSPPDAGNDHLQTLAGIATLLRSGPLRQALLGASEPAAALRALGRASR